MGCIRRKLPIGNIASKRRCPRFSRHDGQNASTTKQPSQRSYTNTSGNAKSRWTGGKKKLDLLPEGKRALIEPAHPQLSIARQGDLVGLPRSTDYYQAQGESEAHLTLMRLLDQQYTDTPYEGVRRMTAW